MPRFVLPYSPLSPSLKENKPCRLGGRDSEQPVSALRRGVKPLREHKPENRSPKTESPQGARTPKSKHAPSARNILVRRLEDKCRSPPINLKVDIEKPSVWEVPKKYSPSSSETVRKGSPRYVNGALRSKEESCEVSSCKRSIFVSTSCLKESPRKNNSRARTSKGDGHRGWSALRRHVRANVNRVSVVEVPASQPEDSPEFSKWGIMPAADGCIEGGKEDVVSEEVTPPPQPTNSPEFVKRGLFPSAGGCFGAGPMVGPEGVGVVRDRRKCKPRGILTIDTESLASSGSLPDEASEMLQSMQLVPVPAMASVEWMVADELGSESCEKSSLECHLHSNTLNIGTTMHTFAPSMTELESVGDPEAFDQPEQERPTYGVLCRDGIPQQWSRLQGCGSPEPKLQELSLLDTNRKEPSLNLTGVQGSVATTTNGELLKHSPETSGCTMGCSTTLHTIRPGLEVVEIPYDSRQPNAVSSTGSHCRIKVQDIAGGNGDFVSGSPGLGEFSIYRGPPEFAAMDRELLRSCLDGSVSSFSWNCLEDGRSPPSICHHSPEGVALSASSNSIAPIPLEKFSRVIYPTRGTPDVYRRECASDVNNGGSPWGELLDSRDGAFEYESPLTEEDLSPVKCVSTTFCPDMPESSEADTVLGVCQSILSTSVDMCRVTSVMKTPGSGASVESHPLPHMLEEGDSFSREAELYSKNSPTDRQELTPSESEIEKCDCRIFVHKTDTDHLHHDGSLSTGQRASDAANIERPQDSSEACKLKRVTDRKKRARTRSGLYEGLQRELELTTSFCCSDEMPIVDENPSHSRGRPTSRSSHFEDLEVAKDIHVVEECRPQTKRDQESQRNIDKRSLVLLDMQRTELRLASQVLMAEALYELTVAYLRKSRGRDCKGSADSQMLTIPRTPLVGPHACESSSTVVPQRESKDCSVSSSLLTEDSHAKLYQSLESWISEQDRSRIGEVQSCVSSTSFSECTKNLQKIRQRAVQNGCQEQSTCGCNNSEQIQPALAAQYGSPVAAAGLILLGVVIVGYICLHGQGCSPKRPA